MFLKASTTSGTQLQVQTKPAFNWEAPLHQTHHINQNQKTAKQNAEAQQRLDKLHRACSSLRGTALAAA